MARLAGSDSTFVRRTTDVAIDEATIAEATITGGANEGIGQTASPEWDRVLALPRTTPLGLDYYRLHRSLTGPPHEHPGGHRVR